MRGRPKIVTALKSVAIALLVYAAPVLSEEIPTSPRETDSVALSATLFRPATLDVKDQFYRDYFSSADEAIRLAYSDRWHYHEIQSSFTQSRATVVHMDIGTFTTSVAGGPTEQDVRSDFAHVALRMRLEAAFRKFLAREENRGIRRAHQFVEGLKAQNVRVSSDPKGAELRFGYDVLTDASRVEYVKGTTGAGLYNSALISSLTEGKLIPASALTVWKDLALGGPTASLGYSLGGKTVSAGLSKALTRSIRGELLTSKPTVDNGSPSSVLVRMTYTF